MTRRHWVTTTAHTPTFNQALRQGSLAVALGVTLLLLASATPAQQVVPVSIPPLPPAATGERRPASSLSGSTSSRPSALGLNSSLVTRHASRPQLDTSFGRLPLSFEPNVGQTDPKVQFLARGRGYSLFLTQDEAVFVLTKNRQAKVEAEKEGLKGYGDKGVRGSNVTAEDQIEDPSRVTRHASREYEQTVLRMRLEGAGANPTIEGTEKLPGIVSYFIGSDPKKWRTNIPTYKKVAYKDIYPGIDLAYYGNQGKLEYDLVVAPGADPKQIQLAFDGAEKIEVDPASGDLVLTLSHPSPLEGEGQGEGGPRAASLRLQKPLVYQLDEKGHKTLVAGDYLLIPNTRHASRVTRHEVSLQLASYDTTRTLVIDPVLFFSTYLGGTGLDRGRHIAVDVAGNTYVAGFTFSNGFPGTAGSLIQSTLNSTSDAFVTKLNAAGTALVYSTYLGGSGGEGANAIAVDVAGQVVLAGETSSSSFPGTAGSTIPSGSSLQSTLAGGIDVFVAKLNAAGTALVYSTYLGGSSDEQGFGLALDSEGAAYVTGMTSSTGFPGTTGSVIPAGSSFQSTFGGGNNDAFVTKLNATGTALVYSTYLGGSGDEGANGIAVDTAGNAYLTGTTIFTGTFPGTAGSPIQSTFGGGINDAFVTKLNGAGTALVYSTYLGGSSNDQGHAIAVDAAGAAYVTGQTSSTSFPGTAGSAIPAGSSFQSTFGGGVTDAFVTKLNATGSALVYSTYLGGNSATNDDGHGIAVDAAGNASVTGHTTSTTFPGTAGSSIQNTFGGGSGDAFVTKLNAAGTALVYSTYLGGSLGENDVQASIAVDAAGNVYVTGSTASTAFPGAAGSSIQSALSGGFDAFVAKICNDPLTSPGTWTLTSGDFLEARRRFTATPLADGRVLVAGGTGIGNAALSSAEIFNPVPSPGTGSFVTTGSLAAARRGHTATRLANGKVLVTGGANAAEASITSAEMFEPAGNMGAGSFSSAGNMGTARQLHAATLLADGRVLITGGVAAASEIYDPAANMGAGGFVPTGSMSVNRMDHTATRLPDGRVLIVGGRTGGGVEHATAEIFDPKANIGVGAFSATGSLPGGVARADHTATLLPDGRVLIAGGRTSDGSLVGAGAVFDPAANTGVGAFSITGSLNTPRYDHSAESLPDGRVLIAGGGTPLTTVVEIFDPTMTSGVGGFVITGPMTQVRSEFPLVMLADGRVLAAGGGGGAGSLDSAELYTPTFCAAVADFTLTPSPPTSRTVVQGQSTSYSISLTAQNGFSSPVSLSVTSVLPAGVSASFSPDAVTPPGSTTLIVSTSGSTLADDYTITVQGTGDSQMSGASVVLTVLDDEGVGLPLAISPVSATVADGTQLTFSASGGTGSYTFSSTIASGGSFVPATRLYTAGGVAGTDRILVTDGTTTVEAEITVIEVMGDVDVSLDGRALAGLGAAQTFNIVADSGGTVLVGLSTDRVHDLNLLPGPYSLRAGASSLDFRVDAACTVTLP